MKRFTKVKLWGGWHHPSSLCFWPSFWIWSGWSFISFLLKM